MGPCSSNPVRPDCVQLHHPVVSRHIDVEMTTFRWEAAAYMQPDTIVFSSCVTADCHCKLECAMHAALELEQAT